MSRSDEAAFMAEATPDQLRAMGRAKHERLTTGELEAVIKRMLQDAKNDTVPEVLRPKPGIVDENVYAFFAGAAFEVLIRKLMEQNGD